MMTALDYQKLALRTENTNCPLDDIHHNLTNEREVLERGS